MNKIFKIAIIATIIFTFTYAPHSSEAQSYKGDYSNKPAQSKKIDEAAPPIPKIFSSKVSSVTQAEKLDVIYNDLLISLWLYASTDFTYQKALFSNMAAERFQLTRYKKEFSGDLRNAMNNLNKNSKGMAKDIDSAQEKYIKIRETIRLSEQEELEVLWDKKIEELKKDSKSYFKMQHRFLNFYNSLVNFILKQGGSYYYDSKDQQVKFYQYAGYKFFGGTIDKLRKLTYEQITLLKTHTPANTDITFK